LTTLQYLPSRHVLSASALPAVDYVDERGLSWEQLGELLGVALSSSQLIGASVVILNPTLDTDGAGARRVVRLLADAQDQARQD
jgi:arginase family enzyme